MIEIKCDRCGKTLNESDIFTLTMTDGQMQKTAHFCHKHGQPMHDSIVKYAEYASKQETDDELQLDLGFD